MDDLLFKLLRGRFFNSYGRFLMRLIMLKRILICDIIIDIITSGYHYKNQFKTKIFHVKYLIAIRTLSSEGFLACRT